MVTRVMGLITFILGVKFVIRVELRGGKKITGKNILNISVILGGRTSVSI